MEIYVEAKFDIHLGGLEVHEVRVGLKRQLEPGEDITKANNELYAQAVQLVKQNLENYQTWRKQNG